MPARLPIQASYAYATSIQALGQYLYACTVQLGMQSRAGLCVLALADHLISGPD